MAAVAGDFVLVAACPRQLYRAAIPQRMQIELGQFNRSRSLRKIPAMREGQQRRKREGRARWRS